MYFVRPRVMQRYDMFFSQKFAPNAFRTLEVWLKNIMYVASIQFFQTQGRKDIFNTSCLMLNLCRDDPLKRQPKKKTTPLFFRDFRRSSEIDGLLLVTSSKTNILNPQHLMVVWFLRCFSSRRLFLSGWTSCLGVVFGASKRIFVHTPPQIRRPLRQRVLNSHIWHLGVWKKHNETFPKRLDGGEKGSRFDGFKEIGWRTCPCPACWCQVPRSYYIFSMCHCYFLEVTASEGLF